MSAVSSVEVDEDGLVPPEDDVVRLYVPVDCPQGVEHPQGPADLSDDLPGLLRGEQGVLEEKVQRVPLDVLLQDQMLLPLGGHLQGDREVGAGVMEQLLVDLGIAGKMPQHKRFSVCPVPDQVYAAPVALLHPPDRLIFCLQNFQQPGIDKNPSPKSKTRCSEHIVFQVKVL